MGGRCGAEHLAARCLIKARLNAAPAEGLQDACRPEGSDVSRILGKIETHPDVALSAEVVDFIGLEVVDEIGHLLGIG